MPPPSSPARPPPASVRPRCPVRPCGYLPPLPFLPTCSPLGPQKILHSYARSPARRLLTLLQSPRKRLPLVGSPSAPQARGQTPCRCACVPPRALRRHPLLLGP